MDVTAMSIDYHKLDAVTIRDTYLLHLMYKCIDSLVDAVLFWTLDASWGY